MPDGPCEFLGAAEELLAGVVGVKELLAIMGVSVV